MKDEQLFFPAWAAIIFFGELLFYAGETKFSPPQDRSPDQPSLSLWWIYGNLKENMNKHSEPEFQPLKEWVLAIADKHQLGRITPDEFDQFVKSSPLKDDDLFWGCLQVIQEDGMIAYGLQQFLEEGLTELQKWIAIPGSLKPWRDWGLAIAKRRRRGRMTADELEKFMKSVPPRDESFVAVILRYYLDMNEEFAKDEVNMKIHSVERLQWVMHELDSAWNRWSARRIWVCDWMAQLPGVVFLCLCFLSLCVFFSLLVELYPRDYSSLYGDILAVALLILHVVVVGLYFAELLGTSPDPQSG